MSIEAMKQWLEALVKARSRIVEAGGSGWKLEAQRCTNAITSLRQAIEQAEKQEHHAKDCALLQIPSRDCDCVPTAQREWVEITDEQIAEAIGDSIDDVYFADFRKVIAKVKEMNT